MCVYVYVYMHSVKTPTITDGCPLAIPGLTLVLLVHNNMASSAHLSVAGLVACAHTNTRPPTIAWTIT